MRTTRPLTSADHTGWIVSVGDNADRNPRPQPCTYGKPHSADTENIPELQI